ncbi:MAG: type VI secretion system tube protein Hcp [Candidatus Peribacteraceae bacterium]|nr:type VI secretion system tube protein Hcp [Candidatus Peribacteraceae bacterium]
MIHSSLRFKKRHAAVLLTLLVLAAAGFSVYRDRSLTIKADVSSGIPFALAATPVAGQTDVEMFLKMDSIEGSATDDKHRGQIVVDSYTWKIVRPPTGKQTGFDAFIITMPASKASPNLFLTNAGGLKITKAVLGVRRSGGAEDFLKWILTDVRIVSFQTVGNTHGDGVQDQITLSVGKVEIEYREPLPSGSFGPVIKKGWDQRMNSVVQY